ncbi:hypothetical protein ALNOE001_04470 [Candidatus Methanobinarius endosymbioticus]|uniref:Uncharacterized protein n=1 Tax=Candidatus Methanobinarius endosymbioticus TaxID=2006182 RepID=A0A366MDS9_9EURY|nr:hypothetical protein ALNOE001_04470 [Candidatus Methanobinarius endosymbioticus]
MKEKLFIHDCNYCNFYHYFRGVIAYESSNDELLINMISQSMTPESYTKFHNLEFKIPKGFNVTKNNSRSNNAQ